MRGARAGDHKGQALRMYFAKRDPAEAPRRPTQVRLGARLRYGLLPKVAGVSGVELGRRRQTQSAVNPEARLFAGEESDVPRVREPKEFGWFELRSLKISRMNVSSGLHDEGGDADRSRNGSRIAWRNNARRRGIEKRRVILSCIEVDWIPEIGRHSARWTSAGAHATHKRRS